MFDVQLAIYALALVVIGLLMAFTNSDDAPLATGSVFTRALMWMAIAIVVFTFAAAFDYRWASTFSWLIYLVNIALLVLTLAIGSGVGGVSRWVSIGPLQFQFSEMAKVFMALVLATGSRRARPRSSSLCTIVGAVLSPAPPLVLVLIQPDLGTSLVFGRHRLRAPCSWRAPACGGSPRGGRGCSWRSSPSSGRTSSRTTRSSASSRSSTPPPTRSGSGFQLLQSQIAVSTGGVFGAA